MAIKIGCGDLVVVNQRSLPSRRVQELRQYGDQSAVHCLADRRRRTAQQPSRVPAQPEIQFPAQRVRSGMADHQAAHRPETRETVQDDRRGSAQLQAGIVLSNSNQRIAFPRQKSSTTEDTDTNGAHGGAEVLARGLRSCFRDLGGRAFAFIAARGGSLAVFAVGASGRAAARRPLPRRGDRSRRFQPGLPSSPRRSRVHRREFQAT